MLQNPSYHSWKKVRNLGLKEGINCLEDYEKFCDLGLYRLEQRLYEMPEAIEKPSVRLIQGLHNIAFRDVYLWAGSFRSPGQTVGVGGFIAADPERIIPELQLTFLQCTEIFENNDPYFAMALFHIRFQRIHPFLDGNGRIGRAILHAQAQRFCNCNFAWPEREKYLQALSECSNLSVSSMVNLVRMGCDAETVSEVIASPFRLAPFMSGDERIGDTLKETLYASRL